MYSLLAVSAPVPTGCPSPSCHACRGGKGRPAVCSMIGVGVPDGATRVEQIPSINARCGRSYNGSFPREKKKKGKLDREPINITRSKKQWQSDSLPIDRWRTWSSNLLFLRVLCSAHCCSACWAMAWERSIRWPGEPVRKEFSPQQQPWSALICCLLGTGKEKENWGNL